MMNRRNLFKMFAALPFVGMVGLPKTRHPLLLDAVIKYKTDAWGEILPGNENFFVGINKRAKYRWVDIESVEDWIKKHPEFELHVKYSYLSPDLSGKRKGDVWVERKKV